MIIMLSVCGLVIAVWIAATGASLDEPWLIVAGMFISILSGILMGLSL